LSALTLRSWQAPELWSPKPQYNELVDVYATGLVFWEILSWHQPVKRYPFEVRRPTTRTVSDRAGPAERARNL